MMHEIINYIIIIIIVLSSEESREDVLLGVIVHSKVLGRSRHHHHRRHKRTHPPHYHSSEKRSKLESKVEVGIGDVTPPESPKKAATAVATPPALTSSIVTSSDTPTMTLLPGMYGTGENEVTSTSITHFSAGIKDDDDDGVDNNGVDVAYSPSDEIEKTMTVPTKNPLPVTSEEFITPSLSPNTMSRLQSLIQTVKDSIASLPSSAEVAAKQDAPQSMLQSATTEENKTNPVTNSDNNANTSSAYVFHESLPVTTTTTTTSVAMVTNLPVMQQQAPSTRQQPSFYGNQDKYNPHPAPPPIYGDKRFEAQFDHHHGYQGKREQWVPYRSNWSPQQR